MPITELVSLESAQQGRAGALLARAFHHDPLYVLLLPDERKRSDRLSWLFDRVIHYALLYGDVHTTLALEGVACWLPPGQTRLTLGRAVRSGLYATPLKMGIAAYRRFDLYERFSGRLHQLFAPQPHWYLWAIGADAENQGRGVGSRLLEPLLRRADARREACYLETGSERNVRFYEKHGFKVAGQGCVPEIGVRVWAMRRDARST
jgi:ribosomal protein S18 acetylase RimI-like enzyme